MRKGFKEMGWRARLCARVLKDCLWLLYVLLLYAKVLREMFISYQYVQGFYGNMAPCVAICEGFREMWWHARLCARVLKTLFVVFAGLVAMRKGFKGNVQLLSLCARVL